jgi:hypothetical protein
MSEEIAVVNYLAAALFIEYLAGIRRSLAKLDYATTIMKAGHQDDEHRKAVELKSAEFKKVGAPHVNTQLPSNRRAGGLLSAVSCWEQMP